MTAQAREGRIAVVGTGLVRSRWAILFACAGLPVSLHDAPPGAAERAHRSASAYRICSGPGSSEIAGDTMIASIARGSTKAGEPFTLKRCAAK